MGAFIGLLAAAGILLIWHGLLVPATPVDDEQSSVQRRSSGQAVVCALAGGLAALIATGLPVAGLLAAIGCAAIPEAIARRAQHRRKEQVSAAWPEVIDALVSAVRAGLSLPEAVCSISERGPSVLREPFAEFAVTYRATGEFESALRRLRERLADPVGDRIVEALLTAREVGGTDLGRMLRTMADVVRRDLRLRGEAAARASWTVNGARLAIAAPWFVLLLMSSRPGTIEAYRTPMGTAILIGAALTSAVAYMLMIKIAALPKQRRVMT